MEISHEKFIAIFREKDKDEKMKKNVRSEKEENMRLNSVNSRKIASLWTCDWLKVLNIYAIQIFLGHTKCEVDIIDKGRYF